jgi:hypothetical protein
MENTSSSAMETVTLTLEEFSKLNQSVYELHTVYHGNLRDYKKVDEIGRILNGFEEVVKRINKERDMDFNRKFNYYESIADSIGLKSTWSIYEVEDMSSTHPFTSAKAIIYKKGHHWGDKDVEILIEGDTWQSLFVAADSAIRMSEDNHHTFIERFEPDGDKLILLTGS